MQHINQQEDWLVRLRSGDRTALRAIFEAHYELVCQSAYRLVQDRSTAEDLAQEVFLRFWEKRERITITVSLPAYLRRMAINEALGHLRRQQRWQQDRSEE
ncbi:sigma-70 family RNA polymerase sigma factor, partial [Arthrospira platensis SPKY1]|nr:sigma-70 family RNA polymerase sigma factor [Arthrospira platensis SPKY1]